MANEIFTSVSQPGTFSQELSGAVIYGMYKTMAQLNENAAELFLNNADTVLKQAGLTLTASIVTGRFVDDFGRICAETRDYCVPIIVPNGLVDAAGDMPRVGPIGHNKQLERKRPVARFAL